MATQSVGKTLPGVALLGRICLSAIFILSGLSKLANFNATHQLMASKAIPSTTFFLGGSIAIEILAGLSLLLGLKARWGALILFIYLVPVTFIFHNFWMFQGADRQLQLINFLKNLAIVGGLFHVIGMGPGRYSIDESQSRMPPLDQRDASIRLRRVS